MSYKIFPRTKDGDQLRLEFKHEEEKVAFENALQSLREYLEKNESPSLNGNRTGFTFATTLQMIIAQEYSDTICKILGLKVLNIYAKDQLNIIWEWEVL